MERYAAVEAPSTAVPNKPAKSRLKQKAGPQIVVRGRMGLTRSTFWSPGTYRKSVVYNPSSTTKAPRRITTCKKKGERSSDRVVRQYGNVNVDRASSAHLGDIIQHVHIYADSGQRTPSRPHNVASGQSLPSFSGPASPFERLSSFCPRLYTSRKPMPTLYTYHGCEIASTELARVYQYSMLYSFDGKKCIRLTINLISIVEARMDNFAKPSVHTTKSSDAPLPFQLISKIQRALKGAVNFTQDAQYNLVVAWSAAQAGQSQSVINGVDLAIRTPFDLPQALQKFTMDYSHWNCPWFLEDDLDHQPLFGSRSSRQLLAFTGSKWMLETRFSPSKPTFEVQAYSMWILRQFSESSGVANFGGVVLDSQQDVVGFLTELPSKGRLHQVISTNQISEQRREKWCRQIVQTFADFHQKGLVVGMPDGRHHPPIAIDGNDNAVLLSHFSTTLTFDHLYLGMTPPECRYHTQSTPATMQTDLYQLGCIIWRATGNRWGEVGRQLPIDSDEYSEHLRRIISLCRAENPDDRLPAHQLLSLFPSVDESIGQISEPPTNIISDFARPESYHDLYGKVATCDGCGRSCPEHRFLCCQCYGGDFDLCLKCFEESKHCLDTTHYLRECIWNIDEETFYSNVKDNGRREIKSIDGLVVGLL